GAARRLLSDRRTQPGRGDRVGVTLSRRGAWPHGSAPGLDGALRCAIRCMSPSGGDRDADGAARSIAEAVARRSYGKLVALLAMRTRDVAAAEDALADAFAAALADWPERGCPAN